MDKFNRYNVAGPGKGKQVEKSDFKWLDQARIKLNQVKIVAENNEEMQFVPKQNFQAKNTIISQLPAQGITLSTLQSQNIVVDTQRTYEQRSAEFDSYDQIESIRQTNKDFQDNLKKLKYQYYETDRKLVQFDDKSYLLERSNKKQKKISSIEPEIIIQPSTYNTHYNQLKFIPSPQFQKPAEDFMQLDTLVNTVIKQPLIQPTRSVSELPQMNQLYQKLDQLDELNFTAITPYSELNNNDNSVMLNNTQVDTFKLQILDLLNIVDGPLSQDQAIRKLEEIIQQNQQLSTENDKLKAKLIKLTVDFETFM